MKSVQNNDHLHIIDEAGPYAFISYSHADLSIVDKYINSFASTCRFWFDEGIKSGDEWITEIGNRIFNCEVFIVFLSNNAIQSHYIKDEISYAYKYAKKMIAVFLEPVNLDRGTDLIINRFQHIKYKEENSTTDNINKILSCLPDNILLNTPKVMPEDDKLHSSSNEYAAPEGEQTSTQLFSDLYSIQGMIGKGGIGEVYSVKSKRTGAEYIMKKQQIINDDTDRFKVSRSIARNELEKLLILNDRPYTPVLIDYMEDNENSFLVMSMMQGITLSKLFSKNIFSETDEIISIVFKIALVLQDVQQHNLVYGDVKPSNFIFDSFGQIGLIDFGSTYALNDLHYTKSFTPHYAAPELTNNYYTGLKFSYDVYALGILFSELLSKNRLTESVRNPQINKILSKMTANSPQNRYQTIGEVVAALELIVPDDYDFILRNLAHSAETITTSNRYSVRKSVSIPLSLTEENDTEYDTHQSLYTWFDYTNSIPRNELEKDEFLDDYPSVPVELEEDELLDDYPSVPVGACESPIDLTHNLSSLLPTGITVSI